MLSRTGMHMEILENGLPVLVVPRPGGGVVTTDMWVATGSADELPEINGVSHFLEHMLFKGTPTHPVGEIDRIIEGVGGYLNAGTSHDFTHYYITVAAGEFTTALDILADVIQNSVLDESELDSERQVILEEYNRKQDSPHGLLWETFYDRVFEVGPYKAPVLGVPESLARIDHEAMLDYYHRHYSPENMVLVIVGDVTPDRAVRAAREAFGNLDRPFQPLVRRDSLPTRYARGVRGVLEKDVNETYGGMAFPAPGLVDHGEAYALDVLQFTLGGGHASRLYQEIKEKRQLATSIHAGYATSRHPDLFYISYTCEEAKREALEQAVLDEIARVCQDGVSESEVSRARKLLTNAHTFSLETANGQSSSVGYYFTLTGDTEFEWNYTDGIRAVTAEDVQARAQRWLKAESLNTMAIRPKGRTA